MRTQVGIVGAGPAGLLLSLLLQRAGVDCVVLESRSREYLESRIRAGLLEEGTVALIDELGARERLHREGMPDPRLDIVLSVAPASSQDEANVIALAMWRTSFGGVNDFGLGSAIAVFLFLLVIPILLLNIRNFRRET